MTGANNALTGAVSLNTSGTGSNASLTNMAATILAASTVGGNLTVTDSDGQPDPDRRADGGGHIVLHDLGVERDDHVTQATNALTGAVTLSTSGTGGNASLTNSRRRFWRPRLSAAT